MKKTIIFALLALTTATSALSRQAYNGTLTKTMPDGSTVQPVYSDLTYVSKTPATATVDTNGLVKGVAAGTTEITVTLTRSTGGNLVAYCNVTVTA